VIGILRAIFAELLGILHHLVEIDDRGGILIAIICCA
jgi:hypothetical protein